MALALVLLLVATAQAWGHEAHKKKAKEAGQQPVVAETPMPTVEHSAAEPHDHASHQPATPSVPSEAPAAAAENNVPKPLAWIGKFHPPVTHFPIALLAAAALAELLLMRTGEASYRSVIRYCVRIGAGAALLAAALGWFFAGVRIIDEEWVMTAHRWAGTSVALLAAGLLYLVERTESSGSERKRLRIALFSAAGLVGATGFLGGALIYGLDHYAW